MAEQQTGTTPGRVRVRRSDPHPVPAGVRAGSRARPVSGIGIALLVLGLAPAACDPADGSAPAAADHRPVHIDSIHPVEEELRRFRATLPAIPDRPTGGAGSLEDLVEAWAAAVNRADANALAALAVDRAEFATFYYPHTRYTREPYELSPALVWFQLTNRSSRGLTRLLRTFQDAPIAVHGVRCAGAPKPMGAGLLHGPCQVTVADAAGGLVDVRLFGPVLERDGRFKFLSYENEL